MPHAFDSAVNSPIGVLTPPTGTRRASSRDHRPRRRRHKRKNRFRDLLRADPTPWHLVVAAALYWAAPSILSRLQSVSLSHDMVFSGVVYLMWSGSKVASERMVMLFDALMALELAAAGLLV